MKLVALQFKTDDTNYQKNLDKLISLIKQASTGAFILAPELCLTGYSYDHLEQANEFSQIAISILKELSKDRTIALTLTIYDKVSKKYKNSVHIFNKQKLIYNTQSKVKLFTLNNEDKYFQAGDEKDIKIIDIDGIKVATLICFEIRFSHLWTKLQGADIILIPAMWGILRKQNFESLTNSLAIMNQCYVIASDSSNDNMASSSGIITPFGDEIRDDSKEFLEIPFDLKLIKKMRRYLNIGIH